MNYVIKQKITKFKKLYKEHRYFIFKNYIWTFGSFIIGALTTLISASILSRVLSPENYGIYKYIFALASLLTGFTLTGFNTSVSIDVAKKEYEKIKPQAKLFFLSGIPAIIVSLILGFIQYQKGSILTGISIILTTIFLILSNVFGLYALILQNEKKHKRNFIIWSIGMIINTILCIAVGIILQSGLGLVLTYSGSLVLFNAIFFFKITKKYPSISWKELKIKPTVWHLSANNIFLSLAQNLDKILLFSFMGPANVAVYNFAIAIPDQFRSIFKNLSRSFFPNLVIKENTKIRTHIFTYTLQLLIVAILFTAIYWIFTPVIFNILFPTYKEIIPFSRIFSISILSGAGLYAYTLLEAKEYNKHLHFISIGGSIFQIALYLIFISTQGLEGAIIATLIGRMWYLIVPIAAIAFIYRKNGFVESQHQ